MRDLRAELRNWDDSAPIEWKPVKGDILVGFVREPAGFDASGAVTSPVVVEEERTGIPFLLQLDSPQLAVLFELHNPRPTDRIGIKCTGEEPEGSTRFIMMIDRDSRSVSAGTPASQDDAYSGATPEERSFIEQMLSDETSSDDSYECPADEGPHIMGVLSREQKCLDRQTKSLERLEAIISQSPDAEPISVQDSEQNRYKPVPEFVAIPYPEGKPRRKRRWLRAMLLIFVLTAACALGMGHALMKGTPHWLIRWLPIH